MAADGLPIDHFPVFYFFVKINQVAKSFRNFDTILDTL